MGSTSNASIETCTGLDDDTTKCGMVMDIEACAGETDQTVGNSVRNDVILSEEETNPEPYLGMQFESDEAAKAWYNDYARCVGFSIRVGRQERSQRTKEIISRQFLCFREGSRDKRYIDRKDRIRPERPHTRVGCKAMIMVKKRGPKKWVLTRFEKAHTHELESPDKVPFLRSHMHVSCTPKRHTETARGACTGTFNEYKECDTEFELSYAKPIVRTQLPMEEQVAELYTRPTFLKFQEELCASLRYIAIKTKEDVDLITYRVTKFGEDNRSHTVTLNVSKMRASCTCLMFEFVRIICRHALIVFRLMNVLMLPSHCIIQRYMRNVKTGVEYEQYDVAVGADCADSMSSRYSDLYQKAIKYAEEGATSLDVYNVAVCSLKRSFDEVLAAKQNAVMDTQLCTSLSGSVLDDNLNGGNPTEHSTNQITSHDPQWRNSKGCPGNSGMELNFEKRPKNERTCTVCGVHGHDYDTCTLRVVGSSLDIVAMTLRPMWNFGICDGPITTPNIPRLIIVLDIFLEPLMA